MVRCGSGGCHKWSEQGCNEVEPIIRTMFKMSKIKKKVISAVARHKLDCPGVAFYGGKTACKTAVGVP